MRIVKNKLCVFFSILIVGIANSGGGNGTKPTGILSLEFMKKCFSRNSRWKMKRFMSVGELMCFFCPFVFASKRFSISNSFLSATEISTPRNFSFSPSPSFTKFHVKSHFNKFGLTCSSCVCFLLNVLWFLPLNRRKNINLQVSESAIIITVRRDYHS